MALSTEQVALEAIKYVNSLPNEDGLIQFPGYAKPITRKAAMNRAVRDIVKETGERSQTALLLEKLTGPDTKHFSGTLLRVEKEERSTRAVLTLDTGSNREAKDAITKQVLPEGQEQVRSERTDSDEGKILAMEAKALVGRRVLLTVYLEQMSGNSGQKVRVVQDIQDLGKPRE